MTSKPHTDTQQHRDYDRVARAIGYVEEHFKEQPSLDDMAASVGLSPYHFDRLFKRWAGVTPKVFLKFLTVEYAKGLLRTSRTILDTAYEAGLSGGGRLHDHFVTMEAVTPGEYKAQGEGVEIAFGVHASRFGRCFVGVTGRGICSFQFLNGGGVDAAIERLTRSWPNARVEQAPDRTAPLVRRIMQRHDPGAGRPLHLVVKGTNFQVKVWQALLRIPPGQALAYEDVAALAGAPHAMRAVGNAMGANPIGYLIPCHRVLRKSGAAGGYLWGPTRKRAILGWEAAQRAIEEGG